MQIIGKYILKFSFPHINLNRMQQLMINIQSNQRHFYLVNNILHIRQWKVRSIHKRRPQKYKGQKNSIALPAKGTKIRL